MTIYANRNGAETIRGAFHELSSNVKRIRLAAPFFSYAQILKALGEQERNIDLIVRLGPSTSYPALRSAFDQPNVKIRFFTSPKFHTKLYIFGDSYALVGSANLTESGLQSNHELAFEVPQSNQDFDDLVALFQAYWNAAPVLDRARLDKYQTIWHAHTSDSSPEREFESDVKDHFGEIEPPGGVTVDKPKTSANILDLEDYRRKYQNFLQCFREVEEIYTSFDQRQQEHLPLRIEIDQFLSYVRETKAPGETHLDTPVREGDDRKSFITDLVKQWFTTRWEWLDTQVVQAYPVINNTLGTEEAIKNADYKSILDALDCCHAFHDCLRFYKGGIAMLHKEFQRRNNLEKTKRCLTYLLHGEGDFVARMGTLIFDPDWKLELMGRSIVQEVYGWVKTKDAPICNSRTMKCLRYLGFDSE